MSRFVHDVELVGRELHDEIEKLKRLAAAIPQLVERRQRQFEKLAEVARSMQAEDHEIAELVARYAEARPSAAGGRGRRRGGRTLPMDIFDLLQAAGPRGATLDDLHTGLSRSRQISKQNLSSTLSRLKSQGKIGKSNGMFLAK
jgi:hypothetical protein